MCEKLPNILVTGGAGYIGSRLVGLLLRNDYNVIVLDNLLYGGDSLLNMWQYPNFKFIKGDILNSGLVDMILRENKIVSIVHLAAIVGDPACAQQPELAKKINYEASLELLNLAVKNEVKRFIFASTCSNYGKMQDPNGYVDETSPLSPVSLYAELKVKFENILLDRYNRKKGFLPICLRFATVYGVSPRMRFDLTVNEFTKELALGKELVVFGEQFWRPYCHVQDICRAVESVLHAKEEKIAGNIYNVGDTAENYQKRMIIDVIRKVVPDVKVKYIKKDEDPRDYRVSFEKIKNQLDFTVSKRLADGINEIKSLIDNKILLDPEDVKYKNV